MSLESSLIKHCSATLASLKVVSLFSFHPACWACLSRKAAAINRRLRKKGLALRIIRADDTRALCGALRQFARFKKCTDVDSWLYHGGQRSQHQLTVAA